MCKHWDDAVCKTKGGLERQSTANNRETAPKQKAHFHAIQIQILKQRKKKKEQKKKQLVLSSSYNILRFLSNIETKSLRYSNERTQELNTGGNSGDGKSTPVTSSEIHVDALPGLPLYICSHFRLGGLSIPEEERGSGGRTGGVVQHHAWAAPRRFHKPGRNGALPGSGSQEWLYRE